MAELPSQLGSQLLIPAGAVRALHRLLPAADEVELLQAQDHLRFRLGSWQLDTDPADGDFPDYHQVVPRPERQAIRVALSTTVLTKALKRVGKISDEKHVKVVVNGAITLSVWDAEFGEAEVAVPVIHNNHRGEDLVIGFNTAYMHDALVTTRNTVEMTFIDELGPMRVDADNGKTAIVMPMRV
jgi:DNA polymerase-3 subunit beta